MTYVMLFGVLDAPQDVAMAKLKIVDYSSGESGQKRGMSATTALFWIVAGPLFVLLLLSWIGRFFFHR